MECTERLTSTGRGNWGYHPVEYVLSTIKRTWRAREGGGTRTVEMYRLTFNLDGSAHSDPIREFVTEVERDHMLESSITDRVSGGNVDVLPAGCGSEFAELVGDELSAVIFVADYLQLQFGNSRTNVYAWPEVRMGGTTLLHGDSGYRDGLCAFIGQVVRSAEVYLDEGLVIEFELGEIVVTASSIRSHDWPEVVEGYGGYIGAGEVPFEEPR